MFLSKYLFFQRTFKVSFKISFDEKTIKSSDAVELLGITLDKNINFKRHIQNICRKANNKTKTFFGLRRCLNLEQARVLIEAAYISSKFRYSTDLDVLLQNE